MNDTFSRRSILRTAPCLFLSTLQGASANNPISLGQGAMSGEVTASSGFLQTRLTTSTELNDKGDLPGAEGVVAFDWAKSDDFHDAQRTPFRKAVAAGDFIVPFAAEGLRFEYAYLTTNSCSPSRSSILTGNYPHNTGAEQLHWRLPSGSKTFAQQLKEMGYYTAAAGKWHLGDFVRDHFDKI